MPQKGELLNWVPLWLTETKYCGGFFEKLCRLFLKIVYGVGSLGGISWMWRNPKAEHEGSQIHF